MKMININLPSEIKFILNQLRCNNHEAYVVGGAIRDSLLGVNPKDYDVASSATVEQLFNIFKDYKVIETGIQHGTITVVINNIPIEVTTFRIDGEYKDNRHPEQVTFTNNIEEDLSRRDFTINALAYNHQEGLIDPHDGLWDIENKVIRCVGDPINRFKEDALRILRCIRFSIKLNFKIHNSTKMAMAGHMELLNNISKERMQSELNQILIHITSRNIMQLHESRILEFIIPELTPLFNTSQNNPYHMYNVGMHTLTALVNTPKELHLRLAVLFHDIGKPQCKSTDENGIDHFYKHSIKSSDMARDIMKRLKYSNEIIERVCKLVLYHDIQIESTRKSVKKWLNKLCDNTLRDVIKVRIADIHAQEYKYLEHRLIKLFDIDDLIDEIIEDEECFSIKDLDITGKDIIELGFTQGKIIGNILNYLLELIIDEPKINNKSQLIEIIQNNKNNFK